ncbi:MAG: dTDP-4-dehydrorhamnose 3,5-epimerase [Candidatus Zixiibacteriota bacterium]|nr:MAG: dTDP-4-dehydrorhamnose 3,5-epimerase [candidate division Zixibacteria bacterium]
MKCSTTGFEGVLLIEPVVIDDNRGFFMECYVRKEFEKFGITAEFVQDNHSLSTAKGTIRGMHYQIHPKAQSKLVRVVKGEILNVVVDIRKGSPSYGKWLGHDLSAANKKLLFIPKGFANGYCTMADDTEICYKVDEYYAPEFDRAFRWNDPQIKIDWPLSDPILSERDRQAPDLSGVENNFVYEGS